MDWNARIFAYCERAGDPGFWAEPLNALTNLAFLAAAGVALRMWLGLADRATRSYELVLIALVATIGAGSFLFHTFATRWAALADVAPITVFMLAYLAYALRHLIGMGPIWTAAATIAFFLSMPVAGMMTMNTVGVFLAGSVSYLPALAVLTIIGAVLQGRGHPAGASILGAALVFAVSLALRTVDGATCNWLSAATGQRVGTHFAWHLLNATLLYLLLRAALRHGRRGQGRRGPARPARTIAGGGGNAHK